MCGFPWIAGCGQLCWDAAFVLCASLWRPPSCHSALVRVCACVCHELAICSWSCYASDGVSCHSASVRVCACVCGNYVISICSCFAFADVFMSQRLGASLCMVQLRRNVASIWMELLSVLLCGLKKVRFILAWPCDGSKFYSSQKHLRRVFLENRDLFLDCVCV